MQFVPQAANRPVCAKHAPRLAPNRAPKRLPQRKRLLDVIGEMGYRYSRDNATRDIGARHIAAFTREIEAPRIISCRMRSECDRSIKRVLPRSCRDFRNPYFSGSKRHFDRRYKRPMLRKSASIDCRGDFEDHPTRYPQTRLQGTAILKSHLRQRNQAMDLVPQRGLRGFAWPSSVGWGDIKSPTNSAASNLPLAARPHVGHIGLDGAVAEWLKAAVC